MEPSPPERGRTDRSFRLLLLGALAAFAYMALPFATPLLAAAVIVALAWPLHARLLRLVRQRAGLASVLSFVILSAGIVGAVALVLGIALPEIGRLSQDVAAVLEGNQLDELLTRLPLGTVERWLGSVLGERVDLDASVATSVRNGAVAAAGAIASALPGLLNFTGRALLQTIIFLLALISFLRHGPAMLGWVRRVSPLQIEHTDQLFTIFASFSRNVVLAGAAGGVVQGVVAGVGYAIAGVERALLFGLITSVVAYVPLIGTTLVWVPLSLLLIAQGRTGTALFVVIWSLVITASVDNLVKPFIVRGQSQLPTLLVFIGVFGGLAWFGLIGILVGPVLVATLVALLRIYEQQFLGARTPP